MSIGIYAGIPYEVKEQDGKRNICLSAENFASLAAAGGTMGMLNDIGEKDPEQVMRDFVAAIPRREHGEVME